MVLFLIALALTVIGSPGEEPGDPIKPYTPIEEIYIWPYPKVYHGTDGGDVVQFETLQFHLIDSITKQAMRIEEDDVIYPLVKRYEKFLYSKDPKRNGEIYNVYFQIKNLNDRTLRFGVSENYTISVHKTACTIYSETIFGAMRGIETFTQLVSDQTLQLLPIYIEDTPRWPWRGLMIDVSRHYLSIETLQKLIDGMSYDKLNCLHIHLVDAQSFPYVVEEYPELSEKGAYDPVNAIYTPQQLKDLVHYAYLRGIRVVPEIDVPGHAYSWHHAFPEIVALCRSKMYNINNIPLDPSKPETYDIVKGVIESLFPIFPDEFVHVGGDEVVFDCWEEIEEITQFMYYRGLDNGRELQGYFMNQVVEFTKPKTSIIWQELAKDMPASNQLSRDAIIEVWMNPEDLRQVTDNGYTVINSAGWYLDRQRPRYINHYLWLDVWEDMYEIDPDDFVLEENRDKILGGEACMWGEQINDLVVEERVFPRLSVVAERLWSQKAVNVNSFDRRILANRANARRGEEELIYDYSEYTTTIDVVRERLMKHTCKDLLRRGLRASPIRPDYCPL